MKSRKNLLLEKFIQIASTYKRGKCLDLGSGRGDYSDRLQGLGFDVVASDLDKERFAYHGKILFEKSDFIHRLPFPDEHFDLILFAEVIEHLMNPFFVIDEIKRILKPKGILILSTPNILNIASRLRFLFEGSYNFFREPTLDYIKLNKNNLQNMHIIPWRYQELEYLLFKNGLKVTGIYTDRIKLSLIIPFLMLFPIMQLQYCLKRRATLKKNGIDYARIQKILLSPALLYGKHLIVSALKE
ncbi:MAG: class I SAM-dependent methyltransferase [Candidatus Omnitrophica bacterium]|nr:class I SAM-dependent methyltransferase [Candidatus Omnitrophota bacterium]